MAETDHHYEQQKLQTFLQELRVVLPGTQLLGGFLLSVPFQPRFEQLDAGQRAVFLATFCATLLALALFLAPSIYHRLATPLHDKRRFIALGTRFLVAGFVPLSVSTVLSVHLLVSVMLGRAWAHGIASGFAALVLVTWWVAPRLRLHERMPLPPE